MGRKAKYFHGIIGKRGKLLKPQWKKYKRERIMGGKMFIYFGRVRTKKGARRKILKEKQKSIFKVTHQRVTKRGKGYDVWLRYGGKRGTPW